MHILMSKNIHTYVYMYIYIYSYYNIYTYIYMCTCITIWLYETSDTSITSTARHRLGRSMRSQPRFATCQMPGFGETCCLSPTSGSCCLQRMRLEHPVLYANQYIPPHGGRCGCGTVFVPITVRGEGAGQACSHEERGCGLARQLDSQSGRAFWRRACERARRRELAKRPADGENRYGKNSVSLSGQASTPGKSGWSWMLVSGPFSCTQSLKRWYYK